MCFIALLTSDPPRITPPNIDLIHHLKNQDNIEELNNFYLDQIILFYMLCFGLIMVIAMIIAWFVACLLILLSLTPNGEHYSVCPQNIPKSAVKEQTKPRNIRLHTEQRAA